MAQHPPRPHTGQRLMRWQAPLGVLASLMLVYLVLLMLLALGPPRLDREPRGRASLPDRPLPAVAR